MTKTEKRITRQDLETAFQQAIGEGEATAKAAVPTAVVAAGAALVVVVALSYLVGKRRGRRRSATIEIKRV